LLKGRSVLFVKAFWVLMYAQSHAVHWTQEYDQGEGLQED